MSVAEVVLLLLAGIVIGAAGICVAAVLVSVLRRIWGPLR